MNHLQQFNCILCYFQHYHNFFYNTIDLSLTTIFSPPASDINICKFIQNNLPITEPFSLILFPVGSKFPLCLGSVIRRINCIFNLSFTYINKSEHSTSVPVSIIEILCDDHDHDHTKFGTIEKS